MFRLKIILTPLELPAVFCTALIGVEKNVDSFCKAGDVPRLVRPMFGPKCPKNVPSPSVIWTKSFESAKLKRLNWTLMKWPLATSIILLWWKSLGYLHSPDSLYLADVQTKGEAILCPITGILWASSSGKTPSEWKMFKGPTKPGVEYFCQINCLEVWRSCQIRTKCGVRPQRTLSHFFPAFSPYFKMMRQKVLHFNVLRQKVLYFNISQT